MPDSIANDVLIRALISAERWWNEGTRTYSKQSKTSEIGETYQPQSNTPFFNLPLYNIDKDILDITLANPSKKILEKYIQKNIVLFPVHPEIIGDMMVPHLSQIESTPVKRVIKVYPTASSRAVIVDDLLFPHILKLHLPRKISRYYRNLGPTTIKHSVSVSNILRSIKCEKFAYLSESIGVAFPNSDVQRGWGFLIRDLMPSPHIKEKRLQIPFFALYAHNPVIPGGEPLLATLVKLSKKDPKKYILNDIIFPLIECWIMAVKQQGILLESHGQNLLLEVGEQLIPTRIIHKDLDTFVDCNVRKKLGLKCENLNPAQMMKPVRHEPKGSIYSLIFDSSIGHHMLDYLAAVMEKYFSIDPKELQQSCQVFFKEKFPDFANYFPPTIYYYGEVPVAQNEFPLIDTKKVPVWRPAY